MGGKGGCYKTYYATPHLNVLEIGLHPLLLYVYPSHKLTLRRGLQLVPIGPTPVRDLIVPDPNETGAQPTT